ncbi:MAG: hypothetical protein WC322_05920 [Candidatus Paceibacterota bacterium]|jgi:hypothetical protein
MKRGAIMREVEAETGELFEKTVRRYAEQGMTMTSASLILGYRGHGPFIRLCKKHGWTQWFENSKPQEYFREFPKEHHMGPPPASIYVEHDGITDTLAGHARRLGLSRYTVYHRRKKKPEDWHYIFYTRKHVTYFKRVKPYGWDRIK